MVLLYLLTRLMKASDELPPNGNLRSDGGEGLTVYRKSPPVASMVVKLASQKLVMQLWSPGVVYIEPATPFLCRPAGLAWLGLAFSDHWLMMKGRPRSHRSPCLLLVMDTSCVFVLSTTTSCVRTDWWSIYYSFPSSNIRVGKCGGRTVSHL